MKKLVLLVVVLALAGCAQIEQRVDQGQELLEQTNAVKTREAMEIICRRVYTSTFNALFTTPEARQAWRQLCQQEAP